MNSRAWLSLRQLVERRDLVGFLAVSHLKISHQNLVLGYSWWIINPLLWVFVYWLLVVGIFDRGEPDYPLFLACAILPWRAFVVSISQSMTSVTSQDRLIKQIAFPKAVLPLSVVLSNGVSLIFGLMVLVVVGWYYGAGVTPFLLFLPVIAFVQLVLTIGIALVLSVLTVYLEDLRNLMLFVLRVWLYLSPSLYAVERIPERFHDWYMLNPFAPIFTSYRAVVMHGEMPNLNGRNIDFLDRFHVIVQPLIIPEKPFRHTWRLRLALDA